jgi:hypothetical protein
MSFNLNAILIDSEHGLTLDRIAEMLRQGIASDPNQSEILHEPGAPPICPPHLRLIWRETDWGDVGDWFALIFLETGTDIQEQNVQHVAIAKNRCCAPDAVRNSKTRVRILFHDDPDRLFTNTAIELMVFLRDLPNAVVFDPQKREFVN